jgi:hypothetical protein
MVENLFVPDKAETPEDHGKEYWQVNNQRIPVPHGMFFVLCFGYQNKKYQLLN